MRISLFDMLPGEYNEGWKTGKAEEIIEEEKDKAAPTGDRLTYELGSYITSTIDLPDNFRKIRVLETTDPCSPESKTRRRYRATIWGGDYVWKTWLIEVFGKQENGERLFIFDPPLVPKKEMEVGVVIS